VPLGYAFLARRRGIGMPAGAKQTRKQQRRKTQPYSLWDADPQSVSDTNTHTMRDTTNRHDENLME
jgi:hypothetical protein